MDINSLLDEAEYKLSSETKPEELERVAKDVRDLYPSHRIAQQLQSKASRLRLARASLRPNRRLPSF